MLPNLSNYIADNFILDTQSSNQIIVQLYKRFTNTNIESWGKFKSNTETKLILRAHYTYIKRLAQLAFLDIQTPEHLLDLQLELRISALSALHNYTLALVRPHSKKLLHSILPANNNKHLETITILCQKLGISLTSNDYYYLNYDFTQDINNYCIHDWYNDDYLYTNLVPIHQCWLYGINEYKWVVSSYVELLNSFLLEHNENYNKYILELLNLHNQSFNNVLHIIPLDVFKANHGIYN